MGVYVNLKEIGPGIANPLCQNCPGMRLIKESVVAIRRYTLVVEETEILENTNNEAIALGTKTELL